MINYYLDRKLEYGSLLFSFLNVNHSLFLEFFILWFILSFFWLSLFWGSVWVTFPFFNTCFSIPRLLTFWHSTIVLFSSFNSKHSSPHHLLLIRASPLFPRNCVSKIERWKLKSRNRKLDLWKILSFLVKFSFWEVRSEWTDESYFKTAIFWFHRMTNWHLYKIIVNPPSTKLKPKWILLLFLFPQF